MSTVFRTESDVFINGQWVPGQDPFDVISPVTGEKIGSFLAATPAQVAEAVAAAWRAFPSYRVARWDVRARLLRRLRQLFLAHQDELADLMIDEVGKTRVDTVTADIMPAVETIDYYLRRTPAVLAPRTLRHFKPPLWGKWGRIDRVPLGAVGIISPWNFPVSLAMAAIIPALAAGNTVVWKPSEQATLTGLAMARLFADAGFPPGVFNVVTGGPAVGAALTASDIETLLFIGGTAAGMKVLQAMASHGKTAILELGGNDAMIVLADADLEQAAAGAVWGACANAGQICSGIKRVIVVGREKADALAARIVQVASGLKMGSGRDPGVAIGPLISSQARERIHAFVMDAAARGGRVLAGGQIPPGPGFFYPPTVVTNVSIDSRLWQEEAFGPLIPIVAVETEADAIAAANSTPFGLSASVWTRDPEHGLAVARQLRAGTVMINDHSSTWGDVRCPWGGFGLSGQGRIHGDEALLELTAPQVVVIDKAGRPKMWWYPYSAGKARFFRAAVDLLYGGLAAKTAALAALVRKRPQGE